MLQIWRAVGVGCGLWLWASSPGLRAEEADESATKKAVKSSPETKPKAELPPPTVKLLEAGNEPKFPIRIKVEKGLTEDLVMTMKMDMSLEMNGAALPPTPIPGQEMTMRFKVTGVAENGDMDYEFAFIKIEIPNEDGVPEAQIQMMRSMLQPMVGLKGTATVSDRGFTRKMTMEKKEGLNPLMVQMLDGLSSSMQSFSSPLPEEPVGTGAKWEVKNEIEMQSIRLKHTAVYELVLITGSLRKLRVTMQQTADEQSIAPPGLPLGAQVHLQSMTSKGTGDILLDQKRVVPRTSKVDTESDAQMAIKIGEQEQKMRQKMKVALELKGQESKDKKK